MKKILLTLLFVCFSLGVFSQSSSMIINELKQTFLNYNVNPYNTYSCKNKGVSITYNAPILTLIIRDGRQSGQWEYIIETTIKFDILKTDFYTGNRIFDSYITHDKQNKIQLYSRNGIEVIKKEIPTSWGYSKETKESQLPQSYVLHTSSNVVVTRVINGFLSLQALAKESNVKKSTPHILDNAELSVGNLSFIDPNNNNKLDANETGCITFKIKNQGPNEAYNIDVYIKDEKKNEGLQYESIHNIPRIKGYEEVTVNVPIKAASNIINTSHKFQVNVLYKSAPIGSNTLFVESYNRARTSNNNGGTRTIKMEKMSGNTYLIPCKVNGLPLDFIFDTGASSVQISKGEAIFMLKNGYLSNDDIRGTQQFQTASGDIIEGTRIIIRKIEIGGMILRDVEASVVHSNNAPLLLGQSVLSRLGKIQIDYSNSTLTIIR